MDFKNLITNENEYFFNSYFIPCNDRSNNGVFRIQIHLFFFNIDYQPHNHFIKFIGFFQAR